MVEPIIERNSWCDQLGIVAKPVPARQYLKNTCERAKDKNIEDLERLAQMFRITGGTKAIPIERVKIFLMSQGYCFVRPYDGKLYAWVKGHPCGLYDSYYDPTEYIFSDSYTGANGNFKLGEDGILWRNDRLMHGVLPILDKYNLLISHAELSLYMGLVNSRLQTIGVAGRDAEAKSWEMLLDNLEDGQLGSVVDRNMLNKFTALPNDGRTDVLTDIIETIQFAKASKWNELGLNANWNAKRESLSHSENLMNADGLMPFVDGMFQCWQEGLDAVNEKYGEYLEDGPYMIEWAGPWAVNDAEEDAREEMANAEIEHADEIVDPTPEEPEQNEPEDEDKGEEENGTAD